MVTPLDWGLGHATRCIPVIKEFLSQGCEVQIATSGNALVLLKQEFPDSRFHEIVSYNVHYAKVIPLAVSLGFQVSKFWGRIKEEHEQIKKIVEEDRIDILISDNRYGCWSAIVPSILITHQVNILLPTLLKWMEPIVNYFIHKLIRNFDQCWVPDELSNRITGKLTEAKGLSLTFIGMLSRFKEVKLVKKKYDILVLLSGPEPSRTLFEKEMIKKLMATAFKAMLVRGLPGNESTVDVGDNVAQENHLNSKELNQVIAESEIILCRSGYSTIMDLAKLSKKAIFIPTPGQTEQLYLAKRLNKNKIAYKTTLKKIDLNKDIALASTYLGFSESYNNALLVKAVKELLE